MEISVFHYTGLTLKNCHQIAYSCKSVGGDIKSNSATTSSYFPVFGHDGTG